ncbi:3-oxoacyl-ACP reductase FabG [Xanthocytophaga agilis]|uniref:3-oxoacyl-ACP reductase FabG n=1 Tax=Xanthocytophaga agilis TaxID=3048010 RepID=A0AAE3UCJ7_9BACT|nr:3-oxoacyl-ACP reductase FabG [Xanthocytophaga agilis]MDJ1500160.1 3-oxoacyl-ACP reductase FabG [Xanthocytophaga agilis]
MKYALVTGGARGIGRAIAVKLAKDGFFVILNYLSNDLEAEKTLAQIQEEGGQGQLLKFDVSDRHQVDTILGGWIEANKDKTIEVLINNAGIRKDTLMLWMEPKDWDSVLNISLGGFYNVTKQALNPMLVKKFGRIINIVSLSGLKGVPGQTNYSAAKAGVIGATKALAQEVGRRGITVNAVAPGFITTEMTADMNEKEIKALIPVNRFGKPEEVAELVSFLASENSSYITGEVISINGGLYS